MARIIAIASQKGGVGKTTTAINLATFLSDACKRTVLVDLDPQANATSGLSCSPPATPPLRILIEDPTAWAKCMVSSRRGDGLKVIPSVANVDVSPDLQSTTPRLPIDLRAALQSLPDLDYVILDCPPTLGAIPLLALRLADSVLIPVQCEYFAMEGLSQMLPLIDQVQAARSKELEIEGLLFTMFCEDLELSREVLAEVSRYFPGAALRTIIPRDVSLAESASHGLPVIEYAPRSRGAWAYLNLAKEIMAHGHEKARARTGLADSQDGSRATPVKPTGNS